MIKTNVCFIMVAGCVAGCAATPAEPAGATGAALAGATLVLTPASGELGPDELPRHRVAWSGGPAFPDTALAAVPWARAAAVLDAERVLHRFERDGRVTTIAADVSTPIVSADGSLLAYAMGDPYGERTVHVRDAAGRERTIAQGTGGPTLLGFDSSARSLFMIARSPGGVVGLHVAELDAPDAAPARCLTNCELRTGTDWGDAFVPPPETWSVETADRLVQR